MKLYINFEIERFELSLKHLLNACLPYHLAIFQKITRNILFYFQ